MTTFTDIGLGSGPNIGDGDTLRAGGAKMNTNNSLAANLTENARFTKLLGVGAAIVVTIVSGAITITNSNIGINGEGAAADNLDTINGGSEGDLLILIRGDADITVTESGNIRLGGTTRVLGSQDRLMLVRSSTTWYELSYADNA